MFGCDWADVVGRQIGATASICAWEDAGWRVRRNIERFAVSRETMEARSPRNGWHLYYAYDRRATITMAHSLGEGIDTRGDGGYIVLPPSWWRDTQDGGPPGQIRP
jgi:Bifunctional DNA primase/polymerase, N-terminal